MVPHDVDPTAGNSLLQSQLSRRLSRLQRRGQRLAGNWDINWLTLLGEDARFLAAANGVVSSELGEALAALDAAVAPLLDPPRVPDSASRDRLAACLHDVARLAPPDVPAAGAGMPDAERSGAGGEARAAADVQDVEFPMSPEQWHRFVYGAASKAPSPAAEVENVAPPPVAVAAAPTEPSVAAAAPLPQPEAEAEAKTLATPSETADTDRLLAPLRSAIDDDRLLLWFQPIMAMRGDAIAQFQALLRLRDADGRLYTAAELVPVAERAGLLSTIDRWSLERCIALVAERARAGQPIRLFVTQSLQSARNGWAATRIDRLLGEQGVAAQAISLELHVADAEAALQDVSRYADTVRALGCGFVLTDFEAGDVAERLLDTLAFDAVRLSPRHLRLTDAPARAELKALVDRLHERGRRVIAPRVDGAGVAAALYGAGVDFVQGNFVQPVNDDLGFDFH